MNPSAPQPQPPSAHTAREDMVYLKIGDWLKYCDRHPVRSGGDFTSLTLKFSRQGYHGIDQITRDHIDVKQLADWIEVGMGTADLLIKVAGTF